MGIYEALIIGIVQGVTEWLPVSSEGMVSLVLVRFFGRDLATAISLALWLHLGTMLAALIYFRKDVREIVTKDFHLLRFIAIATVMSVIVAGPLYLLMKSYHIEGKAAMAVIGIMLVVTGILQRLSKKGYKDKELMKDSYIAGGLQGLAIVPGISRSGMTISTFLLRGYRPDLALKLSFLMSIPASFIASSAMVLEGIMFTADAFIALVVSFIVGLLTIKYFIALSRKIDFSWFCIIFGILISLAFFI